MSCPRLVPLLLCLLLPLQGLAQAAPPEAERAPVTTPPPLVPAPDEPEQAPNEPPADSTEEAPLGEVFPRELPAKGQPGTSAARVMVSLLAGAVGGTLGLIPGSMLAVGGLCLDSCSDGDDSRLLSGLFLAYGGMVAGTSLAITAVGSLMDGAGRFWPTVVGVVLGSLVGLVSGVVVAFAAGELGLVPLIGGPLVGGVIGYELSHSSAFGPRDEFAASGPGVLPVVTVSPRGGVIGGLVGRF